LRTFPGVLLGLHALDFGRFVLRQLGGGAFDGVS
jgi:hypothetical protein